MTTNYKIDKVGRERGFGGKRKRSTHMIKKKASNRAYLSHSCNTFSFPLFSGPRGRLVNVTNSLIT